MGVFEQRPVNHMGGNKCPICNNRYNNQYHKNNIPSYITYQSQLEPYGIKCRKSLGDENILEVGCWYCNKWYIPQNT